MEPTLLAGDTVFVDPSGKPTEGAVIVAAHPTTPGVHIVKRVHFIDELGALYLTGDNPSAVDANDSRTFGSVPRESVLGTVTSRTRS